jgi:phosphoribosylformylglycinamidine synthase
MVPRTFAHRADEYNRAVIYRIDVRSTAGDPHGASIAEQARALGLDAGRIRTERIFLLDTDAPRPQVQRAAAELLADPITETATLVEPAHALPGPRIEVHLKPGVMDPVADSTQKALRDMGIEVREVRTGRAFLVERPLPLEQLDQIASRLLANPVIENVYFEPYLPAGFTSAASHDSTVRQVAIRSLGDDELRKLSREGHLFLSLDEMHAIQDYFRERDREPTDIELETIAQTWSEHCVHKTLKSAVIVRDKNDRELRRYENLIKETIFDSTRELMLRRDGGTEGRGGGATEGRRDGATEGSHPGQRPATSLRPSTPSPLPPAPLCLSVFKDNAGVIAFDEVDAVCFKVETHNHPSAIEPYGGSATGIGGCIRDVLGTGLGARPVANTDVFCVAEPDTKDLPPGVIHPRRVLQRVVAGVRDYGNRMGIPTVNGAVYFDPRYVGNPLVFCGCVGIIPNDKIHKQPRDGDLVVVMGGRTGRDGIHGATFSSAELTDTHSDEFSHAVQIGNAITQKKMMDVLLQARDRGLYTAVTDCGAGGLSSAVGEMGEKLGAEVDLEKVPLKYAGLRYDEIWISEAQERMVLSVPPQHVDELLKLASSEDVEATVIGRFGTPQRDLVLRFRGDEVGRLSMHFLHDGIPMPTRVAVVDGGREEGSEDRSDEGSPQRAATTRLSSPKSERERSSVPPSLRPSAPSPLRDQLLELLSHPNIASKHWVIRQYDHEVQGGSVVKPLVGPLQIGPSDASVIRPKLGSNRGVVVACGLQPHIEDPYEMALAAIDEAVRNAVCVGASLDRLAMLDNFCWPSVDDEITMGTLVRACEACRDAALAYGVPFISGKDSLHNQFTVKETGRVIRIPRTLLISTIGIIDDVRRCVTMDLKTSDGVLMMVRPAEDDAPLEQRVAVHRAVSAALARGLVRACHDVSDGGLLTASAEMAIASGKGIAIRLPARDIANDAFGDRVASYVVEIERSRFADAEAHFAASSDVRLVAVGRVIDQPKLVLSSERDLLAEVSVDDLTRAWRGALDW